VAPDIGRSIFPNMPDVVRGEVARVMSMEETLQNTHDLASDATGPLKGVRILDMTSVA
jgi:hypothetical protein